MPEEFSNHHYWYASTLDLLSATHTTTGTSNNALKPTLLYSYDHAIQGFSAALSPSELIKLKESTGVVSVHSDIPAYMDTTHTYEFLSLNPDFGLWPASDFGKDVIIGVVDTGIWPESRSFNDEGMTEVPTRWKGECESGTAFNSSMCNRKLIGARFFNKGLMANHPNITLRMNSTRDTDGHGTHTSSTAAGYYVEGASFFGYGYGTARGMAPSARVAMYKALWDRDGGSYASDILAAMDSAIKDGVDVISLSLGFGRIPLYLDPVAIASFAAMEKGIVVSVSAGNKGPDYSTVQHGAPWLLTVGASAIDRKFAGTLRLGNGVTIIGMSLFPENAIIQDMALVYNETIYDCDSAEKLSLLAEDKIVLCANTRDPNIQIYNICNSEAAGGILITEVTLFLEAADIICPVIVLSPNSKELETLMNYVNNNSDHSASMKFQQTIYGIKPAPVVATYTSRGPSMELPSVLKPDLIAPGSRILAAWPPNVPAADIKGVGLSSEFNLVTGTSMACPHAAGVAALLKGVHPEWSPAAIRSAMMTTASTLDNTSGFIRDMGNNYKLATPLAMGSGHIDPNKALDPGLVYDTSAMDYIRFLCSMNYTKDQFMAITRSSNYNCSSVSLDLNYPSFFLTIDANASMSSWNSTIVRKFQRTLTNVGDGRATYKANLTNIQGFFVTITPDVLIFNEKYQKLNFTLRMEGRSSEENMVSYGSLTWVDDGEKHFVRSPIVATNI
ncbi:hypothetical protein AQUCO_01500038v1 [Aquilegia coerulea]|uniref:Subtilisin-like protease fibronectin type-III domain-containing protein n=1 Tax=Aquilegia coerulea TaxID=218851 RepID=A0A2G5DS40_AQUCA|nr:hypothetical protein AQUCO_01500038v1 [Aquilegia coerulea]